mmetsp:Transcript_33637/g.64572  ORF Transcript_33637/g.64572 Transcript_33637/m.64572 type:complete len:150 (+) Transcript_33637:404-853(+)
MTPNPPANPNAVIVNAAFLRNFQRCFHRTTRLTSKVIMCDNTPRTQLEIDNKMATNIAKFETSIFFSEMVPTNAFVYMLATTPTARNTQKMSESFATREKSPWNPLSQDGIFRAGVDRIHFVKATRLPVNMIMDISKAKINPLRESFIV